MNLRELFHDWRSTGQAAEVWADAKPIRSDLFGIERLEHHALSLAAAQTVTQGRPLAVASLAGAGERQRQGPACRLSGWRAGAG